MQPPTRLPHVDNPPGPPDLNTIAPSSNHCRACRAQSVHQVQPRAFTLHATPDALAAHVDNRCARSRTTHHAFEQSLPCLPCGTAEHRSVQTTSGFSGDNTDDRNTELHTKAGLAGFAGIAQLLRVSG
ncbi:MAG: hypothetical protein HY962_13130 [Ignavibacteriae bacterium]|nr:hypothetical protein [Ignavibacteriota bacterium]